MGDALCVGRNWMPDLKREFVMRRFEQQQLLKKEGDGEIDRGQTGQGSEKGKA